MKRCRSCRSWVQPETAVCAVCGNDPVVFGNDLTPAGKRVRRAAIGIRIAALLHLIGAGLGLTILPKVEHLFATMLLSSISLILAIGLMRYDYRAYKVAVICYFAWGMVSVISIPYQPGSIFGLLLALLAIYVVGNKTAKAIFERRLPDDA